jgi:hypothetical protein
MSDADLPAVWELEAEYLALGLLNLDDYVVPPRLGIRAGVIGALELARETLHTARGGLRTQPTACAPRGSADSCPGLMRREIWQ